MTDSKFTVYANAERQLCKIIVPEEGEEGLKFFPLEFENKKLIQIHDVNP